MAECRKLPIEFLTQLGYDCFRTVNDEYFSYIHLKIIKIKPKYMRKPKSFTLSIPIRGRATKKGFPFVQRKDEIPLEWSLKGILVPILNLNPIQAEKLEKILITR